jgi:hypothetical protein
MSQKFIHERKILQEVKIKENFIENKNKKEFSLLTVKRKFLVVCFSTKQHLCCSVTMIEGMLLVQVAI